MVEISHTSHVLEIAGPRGQIWRPALQTSSGDLFREPQRLVMAGRFVEGLEAAQDAYIAAHGDMHGVAFRVRSNTETLVGLGAADQILSNPS